MVRWNKWPKLFEGQVINDSYDEPECIWSMSKITTIGFLMKTLRNSLAVPHRKHGLWVMTTGFGSSLELQQLHQHWFKCVISFQRQILQWILNGSQRASQDGQSTDIMGWSYCLQEPKKGKCRGQIWAQSRWTCQASPRQHPQF